MKAWLTLGLLLIAGSASAQTGALVSYELQVHQGAVVTGPPYFRTVTIPITPTLCNQPIFSTTPATIVNPTKADWDDPVNAGRLCLADLTAFFAGLPAGSYISTITSLDDLNRVSGRSAVSNPFTVVPLRAAPTGLQVRP